MDAMITEIQRFSLNDGPGIRTTVFFKGCNLKCAWCHNPETISPLRELHCYADKCIGCFKCVYACPSKAHKKLNGAHMFYKNLCIKCGKCADICYAGAMAVSGTKMTVEEVMFEIVQDKAYYRDGGGVTLSGGEVLCQADFAAALIDACHAQGIQVGIETNLSLPWNVCAPLIEKADLIMCDLKIFDNEQHTKWVGAGCQGIKDNICRLAGTGKPWIVRTPLIPGVSDSADNIAAIAGFLRQTSSDSLLYYELLNFNPLGDSKYRSLKKQNPFADTKPLPFERLSALAAIAAGQGVETRIG